MTRPQALLQYLGALHDDLESVGVEYAVVGALALAPYGFSRETSDIDVLVSRDTAKHLSKLIGLGYLLRYGAKHNMWMLTGGPKIPVDVLVEGHDECVNPIQHRQKLFGVWFIMRDELVAMKRRAGRLQDLVDIQRLED